MKVRRPLDVSEGCIRSRSRIPTVCDIAKRSSFRNVLAIVCDSHVRRVNCRVATKDSEYLLAGTRGRYGSGGSLERTLER